MSSSSPRETSPCEVIAGMVTFIIPCLNEERNVTRCFDSIFIQDYPHEKMEILVADAESTDRTRTLISEWQNTHDIHVSVLDNPRRVAEFGTAEALKKARGAYICIQGFDHEYIHSDFVSTMIRAFSEFPDIAGVHQETLPIPGGGVISNYIASAGWSDPLAMEIIDDPVDMEVRHIEGKVFRRQRFSAACPMILFFKRESITDLIDAETFEEGQVMLRLALTGNNHCAAVDGYGYRHHHTTTLKGFLKKRMKIALKYTTRIQERQTWVQYAEKSLFVAAILHLTFVYPLVYSLGKSLKDRNLYWLCHAPLCFTGVLAYGFAWLKIKLSRSKAW